MSIPFVLTSTNRRRSTSITRTVPAASVWEPSRESRGVPVGARVRTLAPNCSRTAPATFAEFPADTGADARDIRRENRRTFLFGAALGFTLVAGSLHLLMEEEPAIQPGYVATITADVAR